MIDTQKTLECIVEHHSTFESYINYLKVKRGEYKELIYSDDCSKEDRSEAIGKISKIDGILENLDILLGNVKLEDIEAAAKTFVPKMQSSFEK